VGDFDSLGDSSLLDGFDEASIRRYPHAKDYTDTELALRAARERGCTEIVIIGGGGGRLDHLVGILSLFDRDPAPASWVTDSAILQNVTEQVTITGSAGDVVSVFPLGCEECRATSDGLRWPLDGLVWKRGDIGVSNEMVGGSASIEVVSGRLLVIRELEE
jgi:thiamine pyrophosphokinase